MLRIAKEKFLKLEKMLDGVEHTGASNARMRVNAKGLYIKAKNETTRLSASLHIKPQWFSKFILRFTCPLTDPPYTDKWINFSIMEFKRIVNSALPNRHLYVDIWFIVYRANIYTIRFHNKVEDENVKSIQRSTMYVNVESVQWSTMYVDVLETVDPVDTLEYAELVWNVNSADIFEVEMNPDDFINAIHLAVVNNIKYVNLRITNRGVAITVTPSIPKFFLHKGFGCRIGSVGSISYNYAVDFFNAMYLYTISEILKAVRVRLAENMPFSLDLIFDEFAMLRIAEL